jgi:hypothetical protein
LKILFVMLNGGYVRNYDSVLRQLAAEGHDIHIAVEIDRNKMGENAFGRRLAEECPRVTIGPAAVPDDNHWSIAARVGRLVVDYLRYFDRRYAAATALRRRAELVVPRYYKPFVTFVTRLGPLVAATVVKAICKAELAVPLSEPVLDFIRQQQPDVLLLTPLVEPGSIQVDYIKCARALGLPSALCVASWDNLTNKGLMRVAPTQVFVWNEFQRDEAVELHGVPRDRVVVTGAQMFDHWFQWRPSRSREEFCRTAGLDPAQPFVLFLGSSYFIAPREADFGERWISALRRSDDPVVAGAGILVRPHPSSESMTQWRALDLSVWGHTAIWPPHGVDMVADGFRDDFFDSLYHSAAVVGVNTSAQIEAAIVGKVVCTIEVDDFAHSQAGTLHYQHLVKGGLLQVARSLPEHVEQLGAILRNPAAQAERSRQFVEMAVRPFGRDQPSTPRLAAAIVALGATSPAPVVAGAGIRLARTLLGPLAKYIAWLPKRHGYFGYLVLRPIFWIVIPLWAIPYYAAARYAVWREAVVAWWRQWTGQTKRRLAGRVKELRKGAKRTRKVSAQWLTGTSRRGARVVLRAGRRGLFLVRRAASLLAGPDRRGRL